LRVKIIFIREHGEPMDSKGAILLTGYEPFAEIKVNPSIEACRRLQGRIFNGYEVVVEEIPMRYQEVRKIIESHLAEYRPAAAISTGIHSRASRIHVERVAINVGSSEGRPNFGYTRLDQPLNPDGPAAHFTTLPYRDLLAALREAKIPAALSNSAGTVGCNQIFYYLMDYLAREDIKIPAGFIHISRLPEQALDAALPSMSLDLSARAMEVVVETLSRLLD
jgi:pyroglutamyl-peptidase